MRMRRRWRGSVFEVSGSGDAEKRSGCRGVSSPVPVEFMELHRPVMTRETLEGLDAARGGLFVDATLGLGGHSELILRASPDNRVIGFDRDAESIELASGRLAEFGGRFMAVHTDYRQIKEVLAEKGIETVAGILAGLGI